MPKKVLVTGGYGFLGLLLAKHLSDNSSALSWDGRPGVIEVLDVLDVRRDTRNKGQLSTSLVRSQIEADLSDPNTVAEIAKGDYDTIFHLGSAVSAACHRDPKLEGVNIMATKMVMEAASRIYEKSGKKVKVIFPGSCLEFERPIEAADDDTEPNAKGPYGESKWLSARMALNYEDVDFRGVRLPAVVACREPTSAATAYVYSIPNAVLRGEVIQGIVSIRKGKTYIRMPLPEEHRIPVIWMDDAIEAFIKLHNADLKSLGQTRVINATGLSPTAGEIVRELQKQRASVVAEYAADPDTMAVVGIAASRMRGRIGESLGLGAKTSLEEMITKIKMVIELAPYR